MKRPVVLDGRELVCEYLAFKGNMKRSVMRRKLLGILTLAFVLLAIMVAAPARAQDFNRDQTANNGRDDDDRDGRRGREGRLVQPDREAPPARQGQQVRRAQQAPPAQRAQQVRQGPPAQRERQV
jgi:hypothetical protein